MSLIDSAIQFDYFSFDWCQQRRSRKLLVPISRSISHTADGYLYVVFGLLMLYLGYQTFFTIAFVAFTTERAIYFFLKNRVRRNRPPDVIPGFKSIIQASDKFSFPSGHTSAAFLMSTLCTLYFPLAGIFLYPWACSVAWSRVMLGVHFPTDTVAGAVLGSSIAIFVCAQLA